jgi:hypothetical protein
MANSKQQTEKVVRSNDKPAKLTGLTVRSALKGGLAVAGCTPCHKPPTAA